MIRGVLAVADARRSPRLCPASLLRLLPLRRVQVEEGTVRFAGDGFDGLGSAQIGTNDDGVPIVFAMVRPDDDDDDDGEGDEE